MKKLFYNPIEIPYKIHIVAKCFNVDITDEVPFYTGIPVGMKTLFQLAQIECFEEVEIYLTSHNDAYIRDSQKANRKEYVTGWVSLKKVRNGGGWLDDKIF